MQDNLINNAISDLKDTFSKSLKGRCLKVSFNWDISEKTVSEIGGRLIEDYVLCMIPEYIKVNNKASKGIFTKCTIPKSQRAMEDIALQWKANNENEKFNLLIDVKGHNELKKGSRPNLASIRKCKELYSDLERDTDELFIFFCRYKPIVEKKDGKTNITYEILDGSFTQKGIFPLRFLSEKNMNPANIGSGGQILFARENELELTVRTKKEFIELLNKMSLYLEESKKKKKKV